MTNVTAKILNDRKQVIRTVTCDVPMPSGTGETFLANAVKLWGSDVCANLLSGNAFIKAQATMRALASDTKDKKGVVTKGLSPADVAKKMTTWKPGTRETTRDPVKRAAKMVAKLSPEMLAAIVAAASKPELRKGNGAKK